jgi:Uma2 family endonuclease
MATQTRSPQQAHQERWAEVVRDPSLRDLPYKVETNERGQILLSPHSNRHSKQQESVQNLLREHAPPGRQPTEYALATPQGVKAPDVVWMSADREAEMDATGDPSTLAPEICVEVMSESNTDAEMAEKRRLYRSIGAEEVWIVGENGQIRFFADEELNQSTIAPTSPNQLPTD